MVGAREAAVVISINTALRSRRNIAIACAAIIAVVAGLAYWIRSDSNSAGATRQRSAIPVSIASASRQDVPIYLVGLGTVQATFTVGIHSQVDGKLQEVLFSEGQRVKKGDVLARIDPRLFQAALDQALAKKAQDQAMLVSLEKDFARFRD